MKTFTILFSLLISNAFAAEVKISSFQYLGTSRVAELCGELTGELKTNETVEIVSDPGMKVPGYYATAVSKNGKFCVVLRTLSGNADVTHEGHTTSAKSGN